MSHLKETIETYDQYVLTPAGMKEGRSERGFVRWTATTRGTWALWIIAGGVLFLYMCVGLSVSSERAQYDVAVLRREHESFMPR